MSEWTKVATIDEIKGEAHVVVLNGRRIALFNLDDGVYAISDQCSHAQASLSQGEVYEGQVVCPEHGATFDIKTGKNLSFPAVTPVNSYPVRVEDNDIYIQFE